MLTRFDPDAIAPPFSSYSHAVEIPPNARVLHISGQVGVAPDRTFAYDAEGQMVQTWNNLLAILDAAGMGPHDLVKINGYITDETLTPMFRDVRDRMLDGAKPASTLVVISQLAHKDWMVEIEAIAAQEPDAVL